MTKSLEALIATAKHQSEIMEYIASFESQDIDGDDVELRFEVDGFDTGCNVSIVDQCAESASTLNALIEELEQKDKRIAELESRQLSVKLPDYVDGHTLGYGEVNHAIDLCADAIEIAGHAAGITIRIED